MLANKQFSELEDTDLNVDFALRVNDFKSMINLHIYVALPKRGNQLKMCSPVRVLNQQVVNYVCACFYRGSCHQILNGCFVSVEQRPKHSVASL